MEQQYSNNLFDLQVDAPSSSYLSETAKWSRFLAIAGFLICGLFVIMGVVVAVALSGESNTTFGLYGTGLGVGVAMIYIIMGALFFFPCMYLLRFSTRMLTALRSNDQNSLVSGFANLKSCFKFVGILTIVMLAFWAITVIFGIIGAATSYM